MSDWLLRHRPSPALVVACLALLIALGGVSYAAVTLPRNSVGPAQLRNDAVTSKKVKNRSLLAIDFKPGQLRAGARGPKGDKGDAGAPGISGYEIVTGRNDVTNQRFNSVAISCPAGKKAIGGGGATAGGIIPGDGPYVIVDQPAVDGSGWLVQTARGQDGGSVLIGYAICANVS
jgi:hypothetical protein